MATSNNVTQLLKSLPQDPGIYKYFNASGTLIYVGKAKNIKKRVSSYFNRQGTINNKTRKLVSEIINIEFTVVNSEFDALLLENNLIKENQPKYNILLKDDKSFPFICVTKERFPKIFSTRQKENNGNRYFGPYTSVKAMNTVLDLIRKLYKIRTCNFNLSEQNIQAGKFKICLEYHIKNCLGPCEGLQSEADYLKDIDNAVHILKGNLHVARNYFQDNMKEASSNLEFEDAQSYKEKHDLLEKFQTRTVIVGNQFTNADIFTIISEEKVAFINYMRLDNGIINISETFLVNKKLDETDQQILQYAILNIRIKFNSTNKLILSNISLDDWSWTDGPKIIQPQIGDKKKIVDLSLKNALIYKKDYIARADEEKMKPHRIVSQLKSDLRLKDLPNHIECFDNSNIQGTNPVASMVCFKNAKPSKRDYRHYKIKTVVGSDDFASMKEIVGRRYTRLLEEGQPLPQLIVVDGGKGQLNAACEALKEVGAYNQVAIVGIAKRLEEIYYPNDPVPLHLNKKSESLRLLQHMRDEAHRFAITFHRKLRSNASITSELDNIQGFGPKTKTELFKKFKSYQKITEATKEDLETTIGSHKTNALLEYIHKKSPTK